MRAGSTPHHGGHPPTTLITTIHLRKGVNPVEVEGEVGRPSALIHSYVNVVEREEEEDEVEGEQEEVAIRHPIPTHLSHSHTC